MLQKLALFVCFAIGLSFLPKLYQAQQSGTLGLSPSHGQDLKATQSIQNRPHKSKGPKAHYVSGVRQVKIPSDSRGHYVTDFRINGARISGLVDTGATYVAMGETTARRIGISLKPKDFKYSANTANGITKAAHARVKTIEIGSIRVPDVDVLILRDHAISSVLIGMSFMSKLSSFSVHNNELVMTF